MKIIKLIFLRIDRHDLIKSAAQISYYNIIAFLTISVVLVYIANFFPDFIEKIFVNIGNIIPNVVSSVFTSTISQVNVPKNITIIILTTMATVWFASRSFHGFIEAFNKIYDIDNGRKLIKAKALSIFFTLGIFLVIVVMFYLSVMGENFAGTVFKDLEFLKAINFIRRYGAVFGLLLVMTAIYFYLPNMKVKIRHALPGALFTSFVWILLTKFFSYYVANINSFSWILGSFGSLFVFMIWIFWLSIIILIGAEINSYLIKTHNQTNQVN